MEFAENTYAEVYSGSGRLTGRTEVFPNGPSNPTNWVDVSGENIDKFWEDMEWGEHDQCHSPDNPNWACSICQEWGWI